MANQTLLPPADTLARYLAIRADHARLQPGVTALCDQLGLRGADIVRFADGSLPVYAVGHKRVLKLYPPAFNDSYQVEHCVLQAIHHRLPIPTPAVEHAGQFEGWGYILMERLHGQPLTTTWPHLPAAQRQRLAAQLGQALAALHAIPAPELATLGPPDWDRFLAQQRAGCVDRQRAAGLDRAWLEQIPAFLDSVPLDPGPRPVLLHTEVMREHLLVTPHPDGWSLSGLFDFEPAMRGAAEYEFAAVGLFVSRGDADFLRRLLLAYGYDSHQLDDALPRRLLAYALLHRYMDLPWYLEQLPPPPAPILEALAAHWWRLHCADRTAASPRRQLRSRKVGQIQFSAVVDTRLPRLSPVRARIRRRWKRPDDYRGHHRTSTELGSVPREREVIAKRS
jgi:hygromycin-B 7''-O-kinase